MHNRPGRCVLQRPCHSIINHLPRRGVHREDWINVTLSVWTTGLAKLFKRRCLTPLTSTFQDEQLQMLLWILILSPAWAVVRSVWRPASKHLRARQIMFGQIDEKKKKKDPLLSVKKTFGQSAKDKSAVIATVMISKIPTPLSDTYNQQHAWSQQKCARRISTLSLRNHLFSVVAVGLLRWTLDVT